MSTKSTTKLKKRIKKIILPGTALIISSYISTLFAFGTIIGYLATNLFYKRFIKTGEIEPLFIELGDWQIHIHHWIQGGVAVSVAILTVALPLSPFSILSIGAMGGVIFHDIYNDKQWYSVICKKENCEIKKV